ncbi:hypothetical protein FCL47_08675 [Desulfopila sp. IMCC35006]|uniref:hypothetical protein n=1 Tax=Desulfopila sp. IMCC35006 TaxID=2569542 RepID=UPI0010AC6FB2|nr:hypothetical protein [Desulfopila sp. IMCC35006]TKB26478.1 hypothetical protein FCL47_08675 [Desulfopila sp. IMCC35006]
MSKMNWDKANKGYKISQYGSERIEPEQSSSKAKDKFRNKKVSKRFIRVCPYCKKNFRGNDLESHIKNNHEKEVQEEKRRIKSGQPKKITSTVAIIRSEIRFKTKTVIKVKCKYCKEMLIDDENVIRSHNENHHPSIKS